MRRCLIALTAAAAWHPVAAAALFALLRRRPALVAHASAPVVQLVIDQAPDDIAVVVDSALPRYSTELLWPAAAVARRLYDTLLPRPPQLTRPIGWKPRLAAVDAGPVGGRRDG